MDRNEPDLNQAKPSNQPSSKGDEMIVVVLRQIAELRQYVSEWQELADSAIEPNVFYEPWFLIPAIEAFGLEQALEFVLIFAPDPDSESARQRVLCAFFPLARQSRYRGLLVSKFSLWRHIHCYLTTPLLKRGYERACIDLFFKFLSEHPAKAGLMEFGWIRGDGPFHQLLVDHLNQTAKLSDVSEAFTRALFRPAKSSEDYLRCTLTARQRKTLRRRAANLASQGQVEYRTLRQQDDPEVWISSFLKVEASGWKGREGSALRCKDAESKFFRTVASAAFQKSRLLMQALYLDNEPIAYRCAMLASPGSFSFKVAYDERYASYSPGVLLHLENIRQLHCSPGLSWMDSCSSPDNSMLNHLWSDRRTIVTLLVGTGSSRGEFVVALLPLLRWLKRKAKVRKGPTES